MYDVGDGTLIIADSSDAFGVNVQCIVEKAKMSMTIVLPFQARGGETGVLGSLVPSETATNKAIN